ncbi:MAG: HvfC/BufC family peptide modification chaperone [Limnohabitans sp.]
MSEVVPAGYDLRGMKVYRHHVLLGVSQLLEGAYPELRAELSTDDWAVLLRDFIVKTRWSSNFYADLDDQFKLYVNDELNRPSDDIGS